MDLTILMAAVIGGGIALLCEWFLLDSRAANLWFLFAWGVIWLVQGRQYDRMVKQLEGRNDYTE
ncbi:hypothetical protein ACVFI8_08115 [Agarivorans sp. MS3-6]|uniref:hypothetical protein n=1 Tax=Agarivorans sp. TSD2052 TaxID=2937286 RepID=UPI00200C4E8C|nr:hypothetical protein [Agarivorans sp. TSD2052]UPW19041.1 hypothetical protein M0C34_01825 [Agarivorans sp. TSD2052]